MVSFSAKLEASVSSSSSLIVCCNSSSVFFSLRSSFLISPSLASLFFNSYSSKLCFSVISLRSLSSRVTVSLRMLIFSFNYSLVDCTPPPVILRVLSSLLAASSYCFSFSFLASRFSILMVMESITPVFSESSSSSAFSSAFFFFRTDFSFSRLSFCFLQNAICSLSYFYLPQSIYFTAYFTFSDYILSVLFSYSKCLTFFFSSSISTLNYLLSFVAPLVAGGSCVGTYCLASSTFCGGTFFYSTGASSVFYASSRSRLSLLDPAATLVAAVVPGGGGGTTGVPSISSREVGFRNMPWFILALKYYLPPWVPLFLPLGFSSSSPTQSPSPFFSSIGPTYLTVPTSPTQPLAVILTLVPFLSLVARLLACILRFEQLHLVECDSACYKVQTACSWALGLQYKHIIEMYRTRDRNTSNAAYGSHYSYSVSKKPSSIISHKPVGLENLKNTCYISAILQVLFLILPDSMNRGRGNITELLFRLKKSRDTQDYRVFKMEVEKKIEIVQGWEQQDAQEFLISLLDVLDRQNSEVKKVQAVNLDYNQSQNIIDNFKRFQREISKIENSVISNLFSGEMLRKFRCPKGHSKHKFERYQCLSLFFPTPEAPVIGSRFSYSSSLSSITLQQLLAKQFGPENISGLLCEGCKTNTDFSKISILFTAPKYLVLHLSRFKQGYYSNEKINTTVEFDQSLSFLENLSNTQVKYKLIGTINHFGTLNRGHFFAEVKHTDGLWYEINDEEVRPARVQATGNQSKYVYILFYERQK